jgi:hypothetical protein
MVEGLVDELILAFVVAEVIGVVAVAAPLGARLIQFVMVCVMVDTTLTTTGAFETVIGCPLGNGWSTVLNCTYWLT